MKLIDRTTLYYLVYTLFVFALGTVLFYFLVQQVLFDGIDEALHQEKLQLIDNLRYERNQEKIQSRNIILRKISGEQHEVYDHYRTVSVYDSLEEEWSDFRELKSVTKHGHYFYEITIHQPLTEAEALINSLLPVEVVLFLLLLVGVLLINRFITGNVWRPFYALLEKVKNYDLDKSKVIKKEQSGIEEFDELSKSVENMTLKIYNDYLSQKEFNENSSHELQTPLAIIRNKLELLIQSRNLTEEDMVLIQSVFESVNRLSQLNKGLLLLAKIDNLQFADREIVNVESIIRKAAVDFKEAIDDKKLSITIDIAQNRTLQANKTLIETLIYNLISNAIKYNNEGGWIRIELNRVDMVVSNSGNPLSIPAEQMFLRFKKEGTSQQSVGLGLSIVKKICDFYQYDVQYTNHDKYHAIHVIF